MVYPDICQLFGKLHDARLRRASVTAKSGYAARV
jgi:hypothetical protein